VNIQDVVGNVFLSIKSAY